MQNSNVSGKNSSPRSVVDNGLADARQFGEFLFDENRSLRDGYQAPINTANAVPAICETEEDFFGLESRMAINRIPRDYLEKSVLTPTELLHDHRELQRLDDRGALLPAAVSQLARLQTKGREQAPKEREEELYSFVDRIVLRARRADPARLPRLSKRFSETLAAVSAVGHDDPEYLAIVVLSRELAGIRNWIGKLDRLCELAANETDAKAVLLLDTVIADVLGANVIQELIGWKRSLGDAIISMLDLADGTFDVEESCAKETVSALNKLMADEKLPASRHVLISRALSQLRSSSPLFRADPAKEKEEYQRVLARLLVIGGIISGAQVADAIASRGDRIAEVDGADTRSNVSDDSHERSASAARREARYSSSFQTRQIDGHLEDIVDQLDDVFRERVVGELYRRTMSLKDQMVSVTGAYTKLQKTRFNKKNIGWA